MNEAKSISIEIAEQFKTMLIADGKSAKTIESYVGDIVGFVEWLESKGVVFNGVLKRFHITSYRSYLQSIEMKVSTINKKINSLQSFNGFLIDNRYMTESVVDTKKDKAKVAAGSEAEVEVFSDEETERILFYIQDDERVTLRDRMIILMLLYTGVRVS